VETTPAGPRRQEPIAVRARYVFPVSSEPIEGAYVVVRDGRIVDVCTTRPGVDRVIDLDDSLLLPALVNGHAHLEFSDRTEPIGCPRMPFVDWIRAVVGERRSHDRSGRSSAHAIRIRGLAECRASGTAVIGEIATRPWPESADECGDDPAPIVVFREILGADPAAIGALRSVAADHLAGRLPADWIAGLSPHAPYTVGLSLVEDLCRMAATRNAPVAMHIAESPEEGMFLRDRSGPFRTLLEELGAWHPEAWRGGIRAIDYLRALAIADRALVIHGNFLERDEIEFISERRDRISVVHCPRTHAFFGWSAHPVRAMHARGIRVALGTDSRASNPDLSLFADARRLVHRCPDLSPKVVLRMATLHGAEALGRGSRWGSIERGKRALFARIRMSERHRAADPHALIWESEGAASLFDPSRAT